MSVVKIVKAVKEIHPEFVVLVKIGVFYHAYGKDSYILSYLFKYNLKKIESNYSTCGFPENNINRVMANLENNKINYLILDRRNNYDVDEKSDNKKQNNYKKFFEKAYKYVRLKERIDAVYNFMLESMNESDFKNNLIKVEEILYERREV